MPQLIKEHCEEIAEQMNAHCPSGLIAGEPSAILKGWIDRVIRPGVAYEFLEGDSGEGVPKRILKGKTAIVFNTSNTDHRKRMDVFGDPLEMIWKNCVFSLCGVPVIYRQVFSVILTSTEAQRKHWLNEVKATIDSFDVSQRRRFVRNM